MTHEAVPPEHVPADEHIVYRPATIEDSSALAELRWDFHLEDYPGSAAPSERPLFIEACTLWIRHRLALSTWTVWVAEDRATGTIVSQVFVNLVDKVPRPGRLVDQYGYASNIYTRPEWRSRGVGSRLMEWVKWWALGADLAFLLVWPAEAAREFYADLGFVPEGQAINLLLRPEASPEQ
ncbi:MAG: N-acetyltransferase [Dehalococcoidia bacterium]|nr:MAG: N-acetyltransferase [Dehalococcoidia bacterium]